MCETVDKNSVNIKLNAKQIEALRKAEQMPIVYDEDSPELSEEELSQFRRISEIRNEERHKSRF